jgi:hypothetical protein
MSSDVWTVAIVFASPLLARSAMRAMRGRITWNAEAAPLAPVDYQQPASAGVVAGTVPAGELPELHRLASEFGGSFVVERPAEEQA